VQVGGMKQAAASVPGGIGEVGGIDHQRVALPFTYGFVVSIPNAGLLVLNWM
jgi:hypothetical protein